MPFLASHSRRISSLVIPTLVLAIIVNEVLNTTIYTDRELRDMRESAVAMANLGQFESALERLRALSEVAPMDQAIWGDYLTVLVRANQAETAFDLYRDDPERGLPDYAYTELFNAALAMGDIPLAMEFADREVAQSQSAAAVRAARDLALAETAQATAVAAQTPAVPPPVANAPIAPPAPTAQAPAVAQTPPAPQQQVQPPPQVPPAAPAPGVTPPAPGPTPAPPQIAVTAITEPAPQPAPEPENTIVESADNTALATIAETGELARQAVRAAEMAPAEERVAAAERAIAALNTYAAALANGPGTAAELRNEKLDRVRALTLAGRYDEARALFIAMGDPRTLPVFGLLNGADLYIRLEQPDEAATLLAIAREQEPSNRGVLLTQFYLELNREEYAKADEVITALKSYATTDAEVREARMLSAQLNAYSNRLEKAQQELEALIAENPDSADVRQQLAMIYRWRGWPRRALQEYRLAENVSAEPGTAKLGAVSALVDMHSYMEADATLLAAAQAAPQHPELAAARNEQQQRQRMEYRTQVSAGNSSNSPVTGAGSLSLDQRLISAPITEHLRVFAHQRYDWADFGVNKNHLNRVGVGVDFRSSWLDAAFEINKPNVGDGIGFTANAEWHLDDRFTVFGDFASDNSGTPLRGLNANIESTSRGIGVLYRESESRQALARYSRTTLSDGNRREAFTLRHQNAWFLSSRRRLGLTVEAYLGTSSVDRDLNYYSPTEEKALTAVFDYTAPLFRHADREWFHRIAVGAGGYQQEGFGSDAIWDFEYQQVYRIGSNFEINYGLLYRNRVYAGDREGFSALFGGLVWRF